MLLSNLKVAEINSYFYSAKELTEEFLADQYRDLVI